MRKADGRGTDARRLCAVPVRFVPFLPKILRDGSNVGHDQPLTVPAAVGTTSETDVPRTNAAAETEPRITPEAYVRVKVAVAGITETKIKRRVAVARVGVVSG